jgi:uncharacterized BrkB/YihY/UPF0761 family membrane protein
MARTLAAGAATRLEEARDRVPAVDAAWMAWQRDRGLASSLLAGAIAYRLFVWLLPFALLLAAALGFLNAAGEARAEASADDLGFSRYITTTVGDAAQQAEQGRWLILTIGLFALFTTGVAGAKALRAIHFLCWEEVPTKLRRPPVAVLALAGIVLLGAGVTGLAHQARERSSGLGLVVTVAVFVGYALLWLLTSSLLPHGDSPWTALIPGALLFAAGAQALHLFTVYYLLGKIESSSELYGGLGAAAAILLWLYLMGRIIVGAAVLDVVLWRRRSSEAPSAEPEGLLAR